MAIYHLETKIVSRGAGRSAVAAAVYLSCSRMLNEYDGVQHDYTRKQDLGWRQVFLPATAPAEWQDQETLWNAVEQSLKRLEEQEQKYSAELDASLTEYAGLREQTQGFDPVQLYEARQAIRPSKEQEAESRAQEAYGEKYNPLLMFDSKKAVSRMLHEDMERQAMRRMVRQAQKEQQISNKGKRKDQGRDVR